MAVKIFKLARWTGPWGVDLIQGVKYIRMRSGKIRYVIAQAEKVRGQDEEDTVFRETDGDGNFVATWVQKRGGHGSSFGLDEIDGDLCVWQGHLVKGVGWWPLGRPGEFHPVKGVPNGDVSVDPKDDLLSVRRGNRHIVYALSSVKDGAPIVLADTTVPSWGKRFQGSMVTQLADGRIAQLVHRDVESNGASRAHRFVIEKGELVEDGWVDTAPLPGKTSREAEGFLEEEGVISATFRIGGNNSSRTVMAVPLQWQGLVEVGCDSPPPEIQELEMAKDYTTGYGWTASPDPDTWGGNATIDCYGTKFRVRRDLVIGSKDGILADAFRYLIFSFNRRVERISEYAKGDDWSFYFKANANNPNKISEHGGGVAIDINATQHPNGASSKYVGFTKAQVAEIDQILDEMEGIMEWGGNWRSTIDGMHFNMAPGTNSTAGKKEVARVVGELRKRMKADPTNFGLPGMPPAKPLISLRAVQKAIEGRERLDLGEDGKQYQTMLNRFHDYVLEVDGILGKDTRRSTSLAQLKVAQGNGNTTLDKDDCWQDGKTDFHPDLDGIPGKELFAALGIDNSDS